ncbi:MAG: aspartate carbamoyltransferase [Candidatus Brocadiales bacterium]|nr:aspartate carbamoyltransferase [Candidatus Bathyanammoxibius amoris]
MVSFAGRDIISFRDFTKEEILFILSLSKEMETEARPDLLKGKVLATLFFEPSTRTRMSFESAMKLLGGEVISFAEPGATSVVKGESLRDTVKIVAGYASAIVIRHFLDGAARVVADTVDIPVINAGDGANQHPTQTFLDLYTIHKTTGALDGLTIGFIGDLKYGRTVHSLAYALAHFNSSMYFISPPSLRMPPDMLKELDNRGVRFWEVTSLEEASSKLDALYCTRIQKERFADPIEFGKVKDTYHLSKASLDRLNIKESLKILHPLPRVEEMDESLDDTPYAVYFQQAHSGVPVREAILASVLGAKE